MKVLESKKAKYILGIVGVFLFILIYQISSYFSESSFTPSIVDIFSRLFISLASKQLWVDIGETVLAILIGDAIAIVIGILIGVLQDLSTHFAYLVSPIFSMLKHIPPISLFPILILVAGISIWSRVIAIFLVVVFTVTYATKKALDDVDECLIEASHVFGCNKIQTLIRVKLPIAFPVILTGIINSIVASFFSICGIEMIGAGKGIGFRILFFSNTMDFVGCYVYIIVLMCIGFLLTISLKKIQKMFYRITGGY